MDRREIWWRLVHLEPALWRGAVVGVVGLLAALGILVAPAIPDASVGALAGVLAIVQWVWTRPAVTANARVVVEAPDPVAHPGYVVAGDAVTTATNLEIVTAARAVPGDIA